MKSPTSVWRAMAVCFVLCLSALPAVCQAPPRIERIRNGVQLTTGDLNVKVQFYSEGTVRVVKWPAGGTSEKVSLSVIQKDVPELSVQFRRERRGRHAEFGKGQSSVEQERWGDPVSRQ